MNGGRPRIPDTVLLDTHVLIWWFDGDRRLSARATREIARANEICVSSVSFWEVATLVRGGRIALDRDMFRWTADVLAQDRVSSLPLSPNAGVAAGSIPIETFHGDPADRFLCAQARELAAPLITKDKLIHDYARATGDLRTLW